MKLNMIKLFILLQIYFSFLITLFATEPEYITFTGVGDIMMGTDFPLNRKKLPENNGQNLFKYISQDLKGTDIIFGNLEGVLSNNGKCAKDVSNPKYWAFRTPTSFADSLKTAGFNVMSLSNNHAYDFGIQGFNNSISALKTNNIQSAGGKSVFARFQFNHLKIILIAFSTNPNVLSIINIEEAKRLINSLNKQYDIIIVSFHGGKEGIKALHVKNEPEFMYSEPRGNVVQFAHSVIDSGADLVIGHGPHVPRAIELYKNRLIAYSLGNFCTYGIISIKNQAGYAPILKVTMNETGEFIAGKIISCIQKYPGYPVPDPQNRAFNLIKTLTQTDFPETNLTFSDSGDILIKTKE